MRPPLMARSANIGSVLASREMKNFDIQIRITYSNANGSGMHDSRIVPCGWRLLCKSKR